MNGNSKYYILIVFVVLAIIFRAYFAFDAETYDNDEAYYTLRQIESIEDTKLPLYEDKLSYSGRENIFIPGFYYVLYLLSLLMSKALVFKLWMNIFASTSIIAVYFIVHKLTKNITVSLFSAFISAFIPIYLISTTNTISPDSISVPLILFSLYLFLRTDEKKKSFLIPYIVALTLLSAISATVFIVLLSFIIYFIINKVEDIKLSRAKKEVILFSLFSVVWLQFLFYKKALLTHGPYVIWQNIPNELIVNYFSNINIFTIIYFVGIIPFFFGLYVIYRYSFNIKNEQVSLFISLSLVTVFLLIFRLIELNLGLSIFGFCFVIFFGVFYKQLLIFIEKTRFTYLKFYLIILLIFVFFLTSVMPSFALLYNRNTIQQEKINALDWIRVNTNETTTVLGTVDEGNMIASIAKRRNIIDNNFLLIEDINERMEDIRVIYVSPLAVKAIELLNHYEIDYILLDNAKEEYEISDLRYSNDECMEEVFNNGIKIYKVICKLQKNE